MIGTRRIASLLLLLSLLTVFAACSPSADNPGTVKDSTPKYPEVALNLVSVSSPIAPGKEASVEILGTPGAEYRISVRYASGESSAAGLEKKTADEGGKIIWTWKISPAVKPGDYAIVVTDVNRTARIETFFTVAAPEESADPGGEPDDPNKPEEPDEPEKPDDPNEPEEPGDPNEPEEPGEPEQPSQALRLVSFPCPYRPGNNATLKVVGTPGETYRISVFYSTTVSQAKGLEDKVADADGSVSWTFKVGASVKPGEYLVEISGGGEQLKLTLIVK